MPSASQDDLTGFGFSAQQSTLLGANPNQLTTTGTSQATAATVLSRNTELKTASSQAGAVIPTDAKIMHPYYFVNPTSTTGTVYCPVGHTLNATSNGGVAVAQNKAVILYQYKPKLWTYILTA